MADGYTAWHSQAEGTNGRYVHGVAKLNVMSHFLNVIGANVNFNCDKPTLFRVTPYAIERYLVSSCACPTVRPSVTRRYFIETDGQIKLIFGTEASFRLPYTVL